jgi:hypothetical protein
MQEPSLIQFHIIQIYTRLSYTESMVDGIIAFISYSCFIRLSISGQILLCAIIAVLPSHTGIINSSLEGILIILAFVSLSFLRGHHH